MQGRIVNEIVRSVHSGVEHLGCLASLLLAIRGCELSIAPKAEHEADPFVGNSWGIAREETCSIDAEAKPKDSKVESVELTKQGIRIHFLWRGTRR